MAIRVPWDKYETALLIEAYLKVEAKDMSRNDAIHHVSQKLRERAVAAGIEVDDVFRNMNGISMQLQQIESLFKDKIRLKNTSQIFKDMVALYKVNKESFNQLLTEAKKMTAADTLMAENKHPIETSIRNNSEETEQGIPVVMEMKTAEIIEVSEKELTSNVYTVDFVNPTSYAFTRPIYFEYFGEKQNTIKNWTQLYVRLVQCLLEDYPDIIYGLRGQNIGKRGRVDVSGPAGLHCMVAPKAITDTLYIETNLSASNTTDKIRQLLDLCHISYENVLIVYQNTNTTTNESRIEQGKIIVSPNEAVVTTDDTDFSTEKSQEVTFDLMAYRELLAEQYQKGFRLESGIEMKKFRHFWKAKFGKELKEDDDTVRKYISCVSIRHQDFVYLPESMIAPEKEERLLSYIARCFLEGKQAIYYDALFKEFAVELQGERIYNADMLKTYLSHINKGNYYIGRTYLATDNHVMVDPVDEIRNYLISHGTIITIDHLCDLLSHIPSNKIIFALSANKEFVRNTKGEYFHADVVDISNTELSSIADLIQQAIDDKYFITGNELVDAIKVKCPQVLERQPQFSVMGMRDAIGYKLKGTYSFNGNIISEAGKSLSMYDVYAEYCKKSLHITLAELNNLKQALSTNIYFEAVYENSLRISETEFVSKDQAMFDVEKTDEAIDRFCKGIYIPLAEISHFGSFPYAGFAWNSYLLEHYVASYSLKYKLLHTSFNATSCVGAIVKRNAGIENFGDLITDVLANSNITLNRDAVLRYLYDKGLIARRRFTDIEQILIKATTIREQKG